MRAGRAHTACAHGRPRTGESARHGEESRKRGRRKKEGHASTVVATYATYATYGHSPVVQHDEWCPIFRGFYTGRATVGPIYII